MLPLDSRHTIIRDLGYAMVQVTTFCPYCKGTWIPLRLYWHVKNAAIAHAVSFWNRADSSFHSFGHHIVMWSSLNQVTVIIHMMLTQLSSLDSFGLLEWKVWDLCWSAYSIRLCQKSDSAVSCCSNSRFRSHAALHADFIWIW